MIIRTLIIDELAKRGYRAEAQNTIKNGVELEGIRIMSESPIAPVIYTDSEFNLDSIKVLKTDAPFVVDKLTLYKHDIWNEVMTFLGVNNSNQDKKERLVANEVDANDEQIEQARFNMLDARKDACKKINDMFGLNIDVKFRNDNVQKAYEENKINKMFPDLKEEGADNE